MIQWPTDFAYTFSPTHLRGEHFLHAGGPGLVDVGLVLELLGQVLQPLEPHELCQQPLFEALLGAQEAVPGALDVRDHLALRRHVGGAVRQAQLGLFQGESVIWKVIDIIKMFLVNRYTSIICEKVHTVLTLASTKIKFCIF